MKRRRLLILLTLLLLAGAAVNVAVAWLLVGAPDSWTPGGPTSITRKPSLQPYEAMTENEQRAVVERASLERSWAITVAEYETRGRGWLHTYEFDGDPRTADQRLSRIEAGWPVRSLAYWTIEPMPPTDQKVYSRSMLPPRRLLPSSAWFPPRRSRVPVLPVFPGFAINTLFYTAILALPLSVFPIRRRLRARRGRCPKCGYDLAGLGGAGRGGEGGAPCPECGATR